MPIHEHACDCGYRFERLARLADADGPAPACPACGAAGTRRVPSVAALLGQARNQHPHGHAHPAGPAPVTERPPAG